MVSLPFLVSNLCQGFEYNVAKRLGFEVVWGEGALGSGGGAFRRTFGSGHGEHSPGRLVRSLRLHQVRGLEGLFSVTGRERESGFQPPLPSRSGSNRAGVRWNATVTDGESGPGLFVSSRQQVEAARDVSGPSDEQHSSFSWHDA